MMAVRRVPNNTTYHSDTALAKVMVSAPARPAAAKCAPTASGVGSSPASGGPTKIDSGAEAPANSRSR